MCVCIHLSVYMFRQQGDIHTCVRHGCPCLAQSGKACWNTLIPRGRSQKMFGLLIGIITLIDSFCSQWATHLGTEPKREPIQSQIFFSSFFFYPLIYHTDFPGPSFEGKSVLHLSAEKNSCSLLAAVQKVPFNNRFPCTLNKKIYDHL